MPPLSAAQRAMITQFMAATGASEKVAAHYLKSTRYKLEEAADRYLNSDAASNSQQKTEKELDQLFDSLRVPEREPDHNTLGAETLQNYVTSLGAGMETAELFVVLDIIRAEGMGQARRSGFVGGWKDLATTAMCPTTLAAQAEYVRQRCEELRQGVFLPGGAVRPYARQVYRSAFATGKDADKRAIELDVALVFWDMLLGPWWQTRRVDWLSEWKRFLEDKWTRTVSRDMWNMTLEFAVKTMEDDTLGFWDENGAWPGVIDEFVEWCRTTGVVRGTGAAGANGMDLDE